MPECTHIVPVRLTDTEYRRLEALCRKSGLSASEVVRSSLAGIQLRERPPNDLGALYTEINRIGNNINQLARRLNAGLGTGTDVREVKYLLRLVYERMEEVADR